MPRIAHFSDTHLSYRYGRKLDQATGVNLRTMDAENAFLDCIEQMIAAKVQVAVHAGDLFDAPRPSWRSIRTAMRGLNDLSDNGIEVVLIAGNHDTSAIRYRDDVFSVLREGCPFAHIASRDQEYVHFTALNLAFNLIPSHALRQAAPPTRNITNGMINVLVTHGLVSDIPHTRELTTPGEAEVPDAVAGSHAYNYIALGDWHRAQQVRENAWYSGATERFGWGDYLAQPSWLEVELMPRSVATVHQRLLNTRAMIQLPDIPGDGTADQIMRSLEMWFSAALPPRDAMVRVNILHPASDGLMREVNRLATARRFPCLVLQITQTRRDRPAQMVFTDAALPGKIDVEEAFRDYCAQLDKPAEFRETFANKGLAALAAAVQKENERSLMED